MASQLGFCRSCGASIFFLATAQGKSTPLDAAPRDDGTVVIERSPNGTDRAVYLSAANAKRYEGRPRYMSHFATCPDAGQWRHK